MKLYTILSLFFAFGLSSPMYSCNEKYEDYILKIAKRELLIEGGIVFKFQRGFRFNPNIGELFPELDSSQ